MKRFCLVMVLLAAGVAMAFAAGELKVNTLTVKESWPLSEDMKEYAAPEFEPGVSAMIDMPEGRSKLAVAVAKWIAKSLGVEGLDLNSADELAQAVVTKLKREQADVATEFTVTKEYENAKLVTFMISGYDMAAGAAHGMPYCYGATFRKSDGKEMSDHLIRKNARLNTLLWRGLKEHYGVKDTELRNILNVNMKTVTMPSTSPWVTKDGVVFQYGAYEIAPYAAGMPQVIIRPSALTPYLTTEGKALLKK
ncbi:MAG: RsiV family protein [Bacteroidales bacterium]|nr:RsiV family protein [Bacteroidales bacterium]